MSTGEPRRWLLVRREMPVPGEESGSSRWSLDHLFLDQEGVPTLIEVKRSSDTRLRREVVGQMLDYAANAVVYWPLERVQAEFDQTCTQRSEDPVEILTEFLRGELEPERFWDDVRTNLQAGRIRMVFVADVIPTELRRVVEFLNLQLSETGSSDSRSRRSLSNPVVLGRTAMSNPSMASSETSYST